MHYDKNMNEKTKKNIRKELWIPTGSSWIEHKKERKNQEKLENRIFYLNFQSQMHCITTYTNQEHWTDVK